MKVRYIDNNGEKRDGDFELIELDNDLVKLLFNYHLGQECRESDNYFSALQGIRQALEVEGITILCNGSSTNVYPSGMMLDMGNGEKAYRV